MADAAREDLADRSTSGPADAAGPADGPGPAHGEAPVDPAEQDLGRRRFFRQLAADVF